MLGGPLSAPLLGVSYPLLRVGDRESAGAMALGRLLVQQRLVMHLAPGMWLQRLVDAAAMSTDPSVDAAVQVIERLADANRLSAVASAMEEHERLAELAATRLPLSYIDQIVGQYITGSGLWRNALSLRGQPSPAPKQTMCLLGWSARHAIDLDLSRCGFTDQNMPSLWRATSNMHSLMAVRLSDNGLTDRAVPVLRRWGLSLPQLAFFLLERTEIDEAVQQALHDNLERDGAPEVSEVGQRLLTQQALLEVDVFMPLRASLRPGQAGKPVCMLLRHEQLSVRRMTHLSLTGVRWSPAEIAVAAEVLGSSAYALKTLVFDTEDLPTAPEVIRQMTAHSVLASLAPLAELAVLHVSSLPMGEHSTSLLFAQMGTWPSLIELSCYFDADRAGLEGWVSRARRLLRGLLAYRDPTQAHRAAESRRLDVLQQGAGIISSNFVEQLTGQKRPPPAREPLSLWRMVDPTRHLRTGILGVKPSLHGS